MSFSKYRDWNRVYTEHSLKELPWELGRPREVLVDLIEAGRIKPCRALDICCGTGTNTLYMARMGFDVTGIDISLQAIKMAKQKAKEAKVKARFMVGNAVEVPFGNEEFDFVFDMGCFHHMFITDRDPYIEGLCRILNRRTGRYLLVCFSDKNGPAWNHFAKPQLTHYFSDHFQIQNIQHFGSVEGNGFTRFFYAALMQRHEKPCL